LFCKKNICKAKDFFVFKLELPGVSADQREEKAAGMPPTANAGGRNERTGGERMETVQLSPSPKRIPCFAKETFVKQGIFVLKRVELPGESADQGEEKAARMPPTANEGGRKERTGSERMETVRFSPSPK